MSTKSIYESGSNAGLRRANDFLIHPKRFRIPEPLFDEFWREGELAMLFGPPSSGKSILALQLGDGLSRGGGLTGFLHPRGRRRVLYADLRHTDDQFQMRCSHLGVRHRFPKNLLRGRPPEPQYRCEWLTAQIAANKIQVVIIDDLSVIKNTHDGTRETLKLMRRLREIRDKTGVSILIIADSAPSERDRVGENDLGRSRVLCSVADSVFAIGRSLRQVGDRYLVQTRARNARVVWTVRNAPIAKVERTQTGLLALTFDERFSERLEDNKRRLICEISRLVEVEGKTYRDVAKQLGLSKSWVCTLYKRWTPAMEDKPAAEDTDLDDNWDEDNSVEDGEEFYEDHDYAEAEYSGQYGEPDETAPSGGDWLPGVDPRSIPFAAALARRWICDLERDCDNNGREIFVLSRREYDRKPTIWYSQNDRTRDYTRHQRGLYNIDLKNLGPSGTIPDPDLRELT